MNANPRATREGSTVVSGIRQLRKDAGMTQKELAAILDVSRNTVWNWEKGKTVPNVEHLQKLADALNCTPDELLEWGREEKHGLSEEPELSSSAVQDAAGPEASGKGNFSIGLKIKQLRKAAKMSQQKLADALNVSRRTSWGWENGEAVPDAGQLWNIATVLGCTPNDILGWGEGNLPEEPERSDHAVQDAAGPEASGKGNFSIGLKIKQLRKAAKMSQQKLADKIGTDIKTVWNWENGATMPNVEQLRFLAEALGCTPNDLMGWTPDEGAAGIAAIYNRLGPAGRQTLEEVALALLVAQQVEEIQTGGPSRGTGSEQVQSPA